jgi:hypothetical protein
MSHCHNQELYGVAAGKQQVNMDLSLKFDDIRGRRQVSAMASLVSLYKVIVSRFISIDFLAPGPPPLFSDLVYLVGYLERLLS